MSFKNRWTISSSYDFQARRQRSQGRRCCSQTALLWFEVLPDLSPALPGLSSALPGASEVLSGTPMCSQTYHNHFDITPLPVIGDPSYSEGQPECPPRVSYSSEIDASKFTLHILSDSPGGFQWPKYIWLMNLLLILSFINILLFNIGIEFFVLLKTLVILNGGQFLVLLRFVPWVECWHVL